MIVDFNLRLPRDEVSRKTKRRQLTNYPQMYVLTLVPEEAPAEPFSLSPDMASLTAKGSSEGRSSWSETETIRTYVHSRGKERTSRSNNFNFLPTFTLHFFHRRMDVGLTLLLCHLRAVGLEGVHEASHVACFVGAARLLRKRERKRESWTHRELEEQQTGSGFAVRDFCLPGPTRCEQHIPSFVFPPASRASSWHFATPHHTQEVLLVFLHSPSMIIVLDSRRPSSLSVDVNLRLEAFLGGCK